jgi:hypothetical protein
MGALGVLNAVLKSSLKHMLRRDLEPSDVDFLETLPDIIYLEEFSVAQLLQSIKGIVRDAGVRASSTPDDYQAFRKILEEQQMPRNHVEQFISAAKRWETECNQHKSQGLQHSDQSDIEGVLEKQGEHNVTFQKRWFELRGSQMKVSLAHC